MDWSALVIAVISALLGGGGAAAWLRAGGQNRTDYLGKLLERLAQVEARTDQQDKLINEQSRQNSELSHQVGRGEGERAALERNLVEVRELARELTGQVGQLAQRVAEETQERGRANEQAQIARSKAEFLERENNVLRAENERLRRQLPERTEGRRTSDTAVLSEVKE